MYVSGVMSADLLQVTQTFCYGPSVQDETKGHQNQHGIISQRLKHLVWPHLSGLEVKVTTFTSHCPLRQFPQMKHQYSKYHFNW